MKWTWIECAFSIGKWLVSDAQMLWHLHAYTIFVSPEARERGQEKGRELIINSCPMDIFCYVTL